MISPKKTAILLLLLLIAITNALLAQTKASPQGHILSVSDIHFDPYYDPLLVGALVKADYKQWPAIFKSSKITTPGAYGEDSNYPTFASALGAMKKHSPSPTVMIITGDFLSHKFQERFKDNAPAYADSITSFTAKTIQFIAMMLDRSFPKTIILPVLGNNDSYCGNYKTEPNGAFLTMFAKACAPLQHNHSAAADKAFIAQFSKDGYYTYALHDGSGGKLIMLNTVLFSYKYADCDGKPSTAAAAELSWLNGVLKQAKLQKRKLWLASHIPPGIDIYSTVTGKKSCLENITNMMDTSINKQYLKLLITYAPIIKANFAGHTHMDDFRVIYDNGKPVSFIHITPAISVRSDNNPGFQTISYSKQTFVLLNYQTYYYSLNKPSPSWQFEYDFQKTYGVTGITAQSLDLVRKKIGSEFKFQKIYMDFYTLSNPAAASVNTPNWKAYWCGTGNLTTASFASFYCGGVAK